MTAETVADLTVLANNAQCCNTRVGVVGAQSSWRCSATGSFHRETYSALSSSATCVTDFFASPNNIVVASA
jgi:hypothetical protein